MIVDTVRVGELFTPSHFGNGHQTAHQHAAYARDPVDKQPQLKSSPVTRRRLSYGELARWLVWRQHDLHNSDLQPYAAKEIR